VERGKSAGMNDFEARPVTLKTLKELEESVELHQINLQGIGQGIDDGGHHG
jgi:hypothetical protein